MICIKPEFGEPLAALAEQFDGYSLPDGKGADLTGYAASDGLQCTGYLLFRIAARPNITRVSAADAEIGDGLLKTAADFAVRMGASGLTCTDLRDPALLEAVGFVREGEDRYIIDPAKVKRQCCRE